MLAFVVIDGVQPIVTEVLDRFTADSAREIVVVILSLDGRIVSAGDCMQCQSIVRPLRAKAQHTW